MEGAFDLAMLVHVLSWVLIAGGSFFILTGALGLMRMPDVYTRLHAVSVVDTLGAGLLLAGLMLQAGPTLIALKLAFIGILLFFTGPVASHALAQAALHAGIEPKLDEDRRAEAAGAQPSSLLQTVRAPKTPRRGKVKARHRQRRKNT